MPPNFAAASMNVRSIICATTLRLTRSNAAAARSTGREGLPWALNGPRRQRSIYGRASPRIVEDGPERNFVREASAALQLRQIGHSLHLHDLGGGQCRKSGLIARQIALGFCRNATESGPPLVLWRLLYQVRLGWPLANASEATPRTWTHG